MLHKDIDNEGLHKVITEKMFVECTTTLNTLIDQ